MNQLRKMTSGRRFVLGAAAAAAVLALTLGHSACGREDNSPAVTVPKLSSCYPYAEACQELHVGETTWWELRPGD